jgi:hypothetical protein
VGHIRNWHTDTSSDSIHPLRYFQFNIEQPPMTYKDLLTNLKNLTEEQLNREVLLYNFEEDLLLDNEVTALRVTEYDSPGLISAGTPYIVF